MRAKVALRKAVVEISSALLSVTDHRASVGHLRAIRVITVHLTGLLMMEMMDIGHLSMP